MTSSCSRKIVVTHLKSSDEILSSARVVSEVEKCNCTDPENYLPMDDYPQLHDQKQIRINFHFPNSSELIHNYTGEDAETYVKGILTSCNEKLNDNRKMNLPEGNDTPVYDPSYRYVLAEDPNTPSGKGIYVDVDDENWYYIRAGRNRNNYSKKIINNFKVSEDSILNIFAMCYHPDSLKSEKFKAGEAGIAIGNSVKIAGLCEHGVTGGWKLASLLNHEIGHVFGLRHSWVRGDGCDDTPTNPNCWNTEKDGPCSGPISNNMMDYNVSQRAITPCQIGIIHSQMANEKKKVRNLLVKSWCDYDTAKNIVIKDSVTFNRSLDLKGDLIIEDGGVLMLSCRVHLPAGASIIVHPQATLILNECKLHNDCGETWQGIKLLSKGDQKGIVEYRGDVEILNLEQDVSLD